MRRFGKAEKIGIILDELYPEQPIPLDHSDPYTLLVAVMLSAQTTDKKVNEVTPDSVARANTPEKDVKVRCRRNSRTNSADWSRSNQAKNLKRMAEQMVEDGGPVRPDWDFLESLAGVGHRLLV